MGIKQLDNENLRKLPNKYRDVSVMYKEIDHPTLSEYGIGDTVHRLKVNFYVLPLDFLLHFGTDFLVELTSWCMIVILTCHR